MKPVLSLAKCVQFPLLIFLSAVSLGLGGCATDLATGHALSAKGSYEKGQYDQAIQNGKQSTQLDPAYAPGWYWLGMASFRKGDYNGAIAAFKKAIELKPEGDQFQSSHNYLGWSYYLAKDFQEAIESFNRAIELKPTDTDSLQGRALSNYELANYDEAIRDLERALENIQPNNRSALRAVYRWLGWSYYQKGNYDKAIKDATKSIENADSNAKDELRDALQCRGWSYFFKSSFDEAIRDFNQAIANTDPKQKSHLQDALRGKAFAYVGLGDGETSINLIKQAKEALDYDVNLDLSLVYYAMGDREKAWQYRGGRGMIGVAAQDYKSGQVAGAKVVSAVPGGPAARANILAGDVITRINQAEIKSVKDLLRESSALTPNTSARIRLLREGVGKEVTLEGGSAEQIMESNAFLAPIMAKGRDRAVLAKGGLAPVSAEPPSAPLSPGRKEIPKIAVWDLAARDVRPTYAQELTSILSSEVSKLRKYEVYNQENVRTLAGWTAEKMKLGCTDTTCLVALGQMDVAKLISGSVGKIGNRYSISLNLFDTQNARSERMVSEFCRSEDELIELVQLAVRNLLAASP